MADKLMRTMVVMSFFLVIALFSGCGTNETRITEMDNGKQEIVFMNPNDPNYKPAV